MRVEIDDEFPNHPKVVKAGELAAYLWLCATCYCRRHLTGGFVPAEAIPIIRPGPTTRKLVDALLEAGLWSKVDGGFTIHGYTERYDDAAMKLKADNKRLQRRIAGASGGKASWAKRSKQNNSFASTENHDLVRQVASAVVETSDSTVAEPLNGSGIGIGGGSRLEREPEGEPPPRLDLWFNQLCEDYPQGRRQDGYLAQSAFVEQFQRDPRPPAEVWAHMRANLENHKRGHEWRVKRMIPNLDKWLRDGRWKQVHDEEAPAPPPRSNAMDARLLVRQDSTDVADCPHVTPCTSRLVCQRLRTEPELYPVRPEVHA